MKTCLQIIMMTAQAIWEQIKHPLWTADKCVEVVADRWREKEDGNGN